MVLKGVLVAPSSETPGQRCSSGKSVLFPGDSTTVGYVEDFLRHDLGVRWFLVAHPTKAYFSS